MARWRDSVYPSFVPSTTPIRDGFRLVARQPSLAFAEITWRWCFGAAFWTLVILSFSEYLRSLPVSNVDWLMWKSGIPPLMSQALGNTIQGSGYKLLRIAAVLLPSLTIVWIFASAFGRAATLRSLMPSANIRLRTLLGLSLLRAALALAAFLSVIAVFALASRAYVPRLPNALPHPARASAVVIILGAVVWYLWSLGNWILGVASIKADAGYDTLNAVSGAVRELSGRMRRYVAIGAAFSGLHVLCFAVGTWLAFMVLGTAGLLPGKAVLAGLIAVTLAYFALIDFFYITRLAAYVSLQFPDQNASVSQLKPEPELATSR